jgi:hypothetical protein
MSGTPTYVGQLFFNSMTEPTGASEVYHFAQGSYSAAATALTTIASARLATLCTDVQLVGYRLSQDGIRGDVYPISAIAVPSTGGWVTGTDKSLPAWNSILCKWVNANYNRSNHYMRFIPSLQMTGQLFTPTTAYSTAVTAFFNAVVANASYREVRGGVVTLVPISSINTQGTSSRRTGRPFNLFHAHGERTT